MKVAFEKLEFATRKWIAGIRKNYVLEEFHERLLILAGQAWDRAQQAARTIEAEGPIQTDRFGQKKPHPSIQIEAVSMLNFAKLLREAGLDIDRPSDPRPPRQYK